MTEKNEEKKEEPQGLPKLEEDVLKFWETEKIFQRSIDERPKNKPFIFYDGPPYATGLPHVGHLLASTVKDVVPRYKTMQGYRVERRFGWDCHGLPIEVLVEKELGINSKKEIESRGIAAFNEKCREVVLRYVAEWKKTITRLGRWVDFENDYKTMDLPYMESVLWVFKQLYTKGLVYQDYRSSLYCTRCETPLSKMETTMDNSYEDVEDPSIYVAFEIQNKPNTYFLVWTTTPWTLSANLALAVDAKAEYAEVELTAGEEPWVGRRLILAKERLADALTEGTYAVKGSYVGQDFLGWEYNPVQKFIEPEKPAYKVVAADFVTLNEGTGIVHIAPAFGEDDFDLGRKEGLPVLLTIDDSGKFLPAITPWAGQYVKAADESIIEALRRRSILFSSGTVTHSYPFCWRCHSPLIYKVQQSFFVKVSELKESMYATNEEIHWVPQHLKEGRFRKGIETAPDWGISRSRYWGVPLPVWRCDVEACKNESVAGSLDDIETFSGTRPNDLHRPTIDDVTWPCTCGGTMRRVSEVFDVWFDSGSMPYGQVHYPFENKEQFEATFPAEFITEYIGQTRGWFYYLHVLANALFQKPAFRHVVNTGIILATDGTKMSKSKGNMPDSNLLLQKYGSDALRLYLVASPVMQGENVNFDEAGVAETLRRALLPLWNVYSFFALYAPTSGTLSLKENPKQVLDRWVLAKLEELKKEVGAGMEAYELWRAVKPIQPFITDLSTWYVRRSRDRFKGTDEEDKQAALATLFTVLLETSKIIAPFTPFIAETLYQRLRPLLQDAKDSVHLEAWPEIISKNEDDALLVDTILARRVIEVGHALRAQEKIKVRQPLATMSVVGATLSEEMQKVVLEELNVKTYTSEQLSQPKQVSMNDEKGLTVTFDLELTDDLKREGLRREFVRQINSLRKKRGLTIQDRVVIEYTTESKAMLELFSEDKASILGDTLATDLKEGSGVEMVKVNNEEVAISLIRVS
ncbi:MAG: isoleucine--tRNA ligase [Patescibacteria group bacterium]|jgi:isoleucyl-tRNA synthetase